MSYLTDNQLDRMKEIRDETRQDSETTPSDLQVTVLALADLKPYPKNPRHITPAAVNAVAESLKAVRLAATYRHRPQDTSL